MTPPAHTNFTAATLPPEGEREKSSSRLIDYDKQHKKRKYSAVLRDVLRCGKNTGLRHLPSRDYAINQVWCTAVSLACDLLDWLRLLALSDDLAKAEPKTLRYRLLHTAARIVRGQRRRHLKIPETWPWAHDLHHAFTTIFALPLP